MRLREYREKGDKTKRIDLFIWRGRERANEQKWWWKGMKDKGENEVLKMKESELRRREEDERNHSEERIEHSALKTTHHTHLLINNNL